MNSATRRLGSLLLLVALQNATAATWYVKTNGNDGADGTSWATAKQTIQAAIDLTGSTDTVLVSNGVYATGGRVVYGAMTNRIAITHAITVRSVNGPLVTTIRGARDPLTTNGNAAMRCSYVGTNAALSGFTLTNGATRNSGDFPHEQGGGGVWCEDSATVSNCILIGNSAEVYGGGAYHGHIVNCTLAENSARFVGGGANGGALTNCLLSGNRAMQGGGAYFSDLRNCVVVGNSASDVGGGTYEGYLVNCTVVSNSASSAGGGAYNGVIRNSILYFNSAPVGSNVDGVGLGLDLNFCCLTPDPDFGATFNITNDPQFANAASGAFRLSAASPCIDSGNSLLVDWPADIDGNPRVVHGIVDMGAYEFQGYWAWAAAITNGSTNFGDCATDDGYPNLLKFATGSSPTNSDSLARMNGGQSNGCLALRFNRNTNSTDVTLIVEGSSAVTNNAKWSGIATNINGSWGGATNVAEAGATNPVTVTVQDPNPATNRFLRLRVSRP